MIPLANCTDRTVSCQAAINGPCGGRVAAISHFDVLDRRFIILECVSKSPAFRSVARGFAVCSKSGFWCVHRYIPADTEFDAFCVKDTPAIDGVPWDWLRHPGLLSSSATLCASRGCTRTLKRLVDASLAPTSAVRSPRSSPEMQPGDSRLKGKGTPLKVTILQLLLCHFDCANCREALSRSCAELIRRSL